MAENATPNTVVIYDGLCGICQQSVRIIKRLDSNHAIEYLDAQIWDEVHSRYPQLTQDAILGQIHVVAPDGQVFVGYEGVRWLTRSLPLVFWLYPILFLPGITWLGPRVYQWIAAHRLTISRTLGIEVVECEGGTCKLHGSAAKVANK